MEIGWIIRNMVMYGFLLPDRVLFLIQQEDIGCSLISDGHGFQILVGDGRHFITDDGSSMTFMDGYGYLAMNGDLRGFAGDMLRAFMAGLHWHRALACRLHLVRDGTFHMTVGFL